MIKDKNEPFFIAMSTDSLSMPRPWNQKVPSKDPELATRYTHTYPYLLKQKFIKAFPDTYIELNNYAQRGSGIQTAVAKAYDMFSWLNADISVFHFGITDCWLRGENLDTPRFAKDLFEKSLQEIMANKKKYHPQQHSFFLGMSPTNVHMLAKAPTQNQTTAEYNQILKTILQDADMNCHYIDMEAQFAIHGEAILHPDGHHLSNSGHVLVADMLFNAITAEIDLNNQVSAVVPMVANA